MTVNQHRATQAQRHWNQWLRSLYNNEWHYLTYPQCVFALPTRVEIILVQTVR